MLQVSDTLHEKGYVFVSACRSEANSAEIVDGLGRRCTGSAGQIHPLRSTMMDPHLPNTYSGRYGFGEFPYHTDLAHHRTPPPYLLLRCVRGYEQVQTDLIDGLNIVGQVGASLLTRALVQARRPRNGELALMSIWEPHIGRGQLRWDEEYLNPASEAGKEAMELVAAEIAKAPRISISLCHPGDTLLIDNRRMLHARSKVPLACQDRLIERVYLEGIH